MNWSEYVARLIAGETQVTASQKTGIEQSTISRWLRGTNRPKDPATVAHFAQCYGANVLEAFVAAGFLTREEAGMPPEPVLDFAAMVDADPDLSPEAKVHIKNQYGLLKAATVASRSMQLREQIQNIPTLDESTRRHLLAILDGGKENRTQLAAVIELEAEHAARAGVVAQAAREATGNERPEQPDPNVDEPGPEHGA